MKTLLEICKALELQPEVTEMVMEYAEKNKKKLDSFLKRSGNTSEMEENSCGKIDGSGIIISGEIPQARFPVDMIYHPETWDQGLKELREALGEDTDGIGMLTCMLLCTLRTYEDYRRLGISEQIFVDTMKCFPRFVGEHMASYGRYGFDRSFWTPRQIASRLFRIGELEYEMTVEEGKKVISIHIPSDAVLVREKLHDSYLCAKNFFAGKFPDYGSAEMVCESWLLAPELKYVLPEQSRILEFQKEFRLTEVAYGDNEYLEWIFKRRDIPLEQLPENTSLQRNLKKYLISGGKVGIGFGYLKEPAFDGKI
ncbi:MAG: acyltransferase domain-containing protein [Lachnospiraceae bacterium]|nr:acyltransferase domain-containing protein [Lachnospiraceae bacterium]